MLKKSLFTCLLFLILASRPISASASLLINEFSPKDMVNDWVELKATADTSLKNVVLKNSDQILKTFPDLVLKKDDLIMIYFNHNQKDTKQNFYVTAGGLSSNKGLLTLKIESAIMDEICWDSSTNKSPCLNINTLTNGQTFGRKINESEANDLNAWQIFLHPTRQKPNELKNQKPIAKITIQQGQKSDEVPLTIDLSGQGSTDPDHDRLNYSWQWSNGFTSQQGNLSPYTFTEPGHYKISLMVTDPFGATDETNLSIIAKNQKNPKEKPGKTIKTASAGYSLASASIIITEIFPNPKEKDTGQEWLELFNPGNKQVNLQNWQINNKKNQKKSFKIKNKTIDANSYLLINDLKIALLNTEGYLALYQPNGQLSDEVTYGQSQEAKSYSRIFDQIESINGSTWQWTDSPTPGQANPILQKISGKIIKTADHSFTLETNEANYEISFLDIPKALAESNFKKGSEVNLTAEKLSPNHLLLKDYQITKPAETKQTSQPIIIILILSLLALISLAGFYKSKILNSNSR